MCTKLADAREVVRRLKLSGFAATAAAQTPYLGVDVGGGKQHARATRTARISRHRRMHAKVVKYARTARRYRLTA
eukprot:1906732-Pyramimonas_sp.AAC.1